MLRRSVRAVLLIHKLSQLSCNTSHWLFGIPSQMMVLPPYKSLFVLIRPLLRVQRFMRQSRARYAHKGCLSVITSHNRTCHCYRLTQRDVNISPLTILTLTSLFTTMSQSQVQTPLNHDLSPSKSLPLKQEKPCRTTLAATAHTPTSVQKTLGTTSNTTSPALFGAARSALVLR